MNVHDASVRFRTFVLAGSTVLRVEVGGELHAVFELWPRDAIDLADLLLTTAQKALEQEAQFPADYLREPECPSEPGEVPF